MALPQKFHIPWESIDPELRHGGVPGELAGEYVGPDLGDNKRTLNLDMVTVFAACRDVASALSVHPSADTEGHPVRNAIEETLKGTNYVSERILDRISASSNRMFSWTHATPPAHGFRVRPIRFPLRNSFLHNTVFTLIGTLVEIAENNANGHHSRIAPASSAAILAPLWHLRANIARDWFDLEVGGELSVEELAAVFEGVAPKEPAFVAQGDSHPLPSQQAVSDALAGIDVLRWHPTEEHWAVFGKKVDALYTAERLFQPEGALRATEDIAPESPTVPAASVPGGQPA